LLLALAFAAGIGPVAAQQPGATIDTTARYPWRLSYFPYVTAEPNDGVMAMGRVVWFQQSRWNARTSVDRQVAVEGGYSTRDAWLARVEGVFPGLAPGWRLKVNAQAESSPFLGEVYDAIVLRGTDQHATAELTRTIAGPLLLAFRGSVAHAHTDQVSSALPGLRPVHDVEANARLAVVVDLRDREFDTRRGALLQTGVLIGRATEAVDAGGIILSSINNTATYHEWYGLASGWLPLGSATRFTARIGARALSIPSAFDAMRTIPAWEDDITVLGGPESDRALPPAGELSRGLLLGSAEARHDLVTFPGGAVAVLGFVDAGRPFIDLSCAQQAPFLPETRGCGTGSLQLTFDHWIVGPGIGVSLRLLRNAVLTATVARAEHATRFYLQSGWSW
jgi:hypothetical protein